MSQLHMISMSVNLRELHRLSAIRGWEMDEGRALHHMLSETFGKSALSVFRLMPGGGGSHQATLYAYAAKMEGELQEAARTCAPPEYAALFDTRHLRSKPMPDQWVRDKRLTFDVRVRPVRRLLKPLEGWSHSSQRRVQEPFKKGAEVDAFLVAALRKYPDGPPDGFNARQFRAETYLAWLAERLAPAARLEKAAIASSDRKLALRDKGELYGPDVIFHGELIVIEPERFVSLLKGGVGRHTSYGYGMLLLRPAGR